MLAEIRSFVNWVRRRNPHAHTWRDYLTVRGMGATEHVFLYRNAPLYKDLVHSRLLAVGERVGVPVSPHRLRHTFATQLLNAGCRTHHLDPALAGPPTTELDANLRPGLRPHRRAGLLRRDAAHRATAGTHR